MTELAIQKEKEAKNQRNKKKTERTPTQVKVVTRWNYTAEPSHLFKQLMSILLQSGQDKDRVGNNKSLALDKFPL